MATFEIKSTEELSNFIENKQIKVGDIIIYRCELCGKWVLRKHKRVNLSDKNMYLKLWCQKCKTEYKYLLKFGTKYPFRNKQFRKNILYAGMKKKYGKPHALQIDKFRKQAYETTKKNFNSNHPFSCDEMINRYKSGNLKKWGVEWSLQNSSVKEKANKTMINRYGTTNLFYSKDFQHKLKDYWKIKFNVDNVSQIPETRTKTKQTLLKRTGVDYVKLNRYNYYGIMFDSSWELAVWIYYIDHNIKIIREPIKLTYLDIKGISHDYYPDFYIEGIGYVEIKGDLFLKDNGSMYCPFIKRHCISTRSTSKEIEYYNNLYEFKHQCGINNGVIFWTNKDIKPYIEYCNKYHPRWDVIYCEDNYYNPSYWCLYYNNPIMYYVTKYIYNNSITPYNKIDNDGYIILDSNNKGITPYDIGRKR